MTSTPGYDALLALHVMSAVIGFGAVGATGAYATAVRRSADPFNSEPLRRFFRPGHNLAGRALYLVPLLGAALLSMNHGDVRKAYPWIGLSLWIGAVGLAHTAVWPTEKMIQRALALGARGANGRVELERACRRCGTAVAATALIFVAALVTMIAQP